MKISLVLVLLLESIYIEYDEKLFIVKSKKVRVRVERKLSDPIFDVKTIKLAKNVEEELCF